MALTHEVVARFSGPSVWGQTDCVQWLMACAGLSSPRAAHWYRECATEARALAHAARAHGGYVEAVVHELAAHGYRAADDETLRPGDVLLVEGAMHGHLPAGVTPAGELVVRHAFGVAPASGTITHHLRRRS